MTIQAITDNTTQQNGTTADETFAANVAMTQVKESAATTNYGTSNTAESTKWASSDHTHTLVKLDTSNIPASATINSATLYLKVQFIGGVSQTMDARALLRDWIEAQATWNIYSTGNSWTTGGALSAGNDRSSTVLGNATVPAVGSWIALDVTSHIQSVVNGSVTDYGFHIERNGTGNESSTWCTWYTDDSLTPNMPELIVDYTASSGISIPVVMAHRRNQGMI